MAFGVTVRAAVILFTIVTVSGWQNDPLCGTRGVDLVPELKMIGGRDAQVGEWPWHGGLLVNRNYVRCGVTILTTEWVVTSARCIGFINLPGIYSVVGGLTDLRVGEGRQQISDVSEIYIHPNYTWSDNENDIALLRLATPFTISEYVRTICVPRSADEEDFNPGTPCVATGWGAVVESDIDSVYPFLQEMHMLVVEKEFCQEQYPNDVIIDEMICAGEPDDGQSACEYDAGGPLMAVSFNTWYLAGVISGDDCGDQSGVFTRITSYESWIEPIFDSRVPDTVAPCTDSQFICPDGWCADYTTKCNNIVGDGCANGGDERLCSGYTELFDPFLFTYKLDDSSVVWSVRVINNHDCSRLCLTDPDHTKPACLAFDVITDSDGYICNFAADAFDTIQIPTNESIMHFEIEKFPTVDRLDPITAPYGRFGATRFIVDDTVTGPKQFWEFAPAIRGTIPGIIFRFPVVHAGDDDTCMNTVTIHDGLFETDDVVFQSCLKDLPTTDEGVFVHGANGNLVVYDQPIKDLGFIGKYIAVTYCDGELSTDNGQFSSPNFPNMYPDFSMCSTKITAPTGSHILVNMASLMLESGDGETCNSDSLSVYDAGEADEDKLIGVYCGETFPDYIRSTGQELYFVFRSDGLVHFSGFNATYNFVSDSVLACGIRTIPLQPEINLIGGQNAQQGEWPWQAAILVNQVIRCGAALVDPMWVLTTASCIDSYVFPEIYTVLMGLNNLAGGSGNTQFIQVEEIFVNPDFIWSGVDNNIALLKLTTPFNITDHVRTVCVPEASAVFDVGTMCTATGWGSTETSERPSPYQYLREIEVSIIDQDFCRSQHNHDITDNMFCASGDGKDTCNFDLGGPLVTEVGGEYVLAGLISSQFCQDGSMPGTYTRVAAFAGWIQPIFTGNDPERIANCTRNEYTCPGGWCAGYDTKCNGLNDGCVYGGDENFCDGFSEFYDPYLFNRRLTPDSIVESIGPVFELSDCARLCRTVPGYLCLAYDVTVNENSYTCFLAGKDFDTVPMEVNRNYLHFEIENTPDPSSTITYSNGKIGTPLYDPNYSGPGTGLYWILQPELSGLMPGIVFRVPVVNGDSGNCERVIFRSGTSDSSPVAYQPCLDDIDMSAEGFFVPTTTGVRVEFDTSDAQMYGFMAKFETVSYCSGTFSDTPGYFTSPNYPQFYPANSICSTLVTSPVGTRPSIVFTDFLLEDDSSGACIDTVSIYDSMEADESKLVGVYCGSQLPPVATGSGQNLFVVFKSDGALNYKGFNATFDFGEDGSLCGEQRVPLSQIVGGGNAQEGEYPWQALLLSQNAARCGGALLTPNWIITSASCIDTPNFPEVGSVLMGVTDLNVGSGENVQIVNVEDYFVHPNFQWWDNNYDIALVKLATPFRITDYVRTLCDPEPSMAFLPGTNCVATGWGSLADGERLSAFLQEIEVDLISQAECQSKIPDDEITENMVCAYAEGKDTCTFDAGGPLVTKSGDLWYLVGVISSQFCGLDDLPGIYTNVTAFAEWMDPIYNDGEPDTIPECTYEEYQCPEGWCADYSTKCNGLDDGCRYGGDETTCVGETEYFDPFLFTTRLNESSVRDTTEVADNAECASLCLGKTNFICLAFDVYFESRPGYTCAFAGEDYETVKVSFSFSNTHLQIEKFPMPFDSTTPPLTSTVGKIGAPRWIPSISSGSYFYWNVRSDLTNVGHGYIFHFPVVNSGDPNRCDNDIVFRLGDLNDGPAVAQYCLHELPTTALFVTVYPYQDLFIEFKTVDVNQYGFIAKYAEVNYCSSVITGSADSNGTFTSPNYPMPYPADAHCITRIRAPVGYNVEVQFTDFQLETDSSVTCGNDFDTVTLYDGPETDVSRRIGAYCGSTIPDRFTSSGDSFTVEFKSDAFLNYKGFSINYQFVEVQECNNNFYKSQGAFTSLNYPELYPPSTVCPTRITTSPDYRVLLVFLDVDLEPDSSPGCGAGFDAVSIYDSYKEEEDKLIGRVCGSDPEQTVYTSSGDSLYVHFESDSTQEFTGFNAIFYTYPALSSCDKIFTVAPNTFNSLGYPNNYPNRITCTTLIMAPVGSVVQLTFLDFELEGANFNGDCVWDSLNIYNGITSDPDNMIGSYCGEEIPEVILSANTSIFLEFSSDASSNFRGYEALFEFIAANETGCDNIFIKGPGEVSSPFYPENYPSGSSCRTLFIAPDDMIVRIEIQDFMLEADNEGCTQDWDTLTIYDGGDENSNKTGTYCGNSIPGFFESTGTRMYMVFKSDSSVTRRGFHATYEFRDGPVTIPPPPPLDDDQCGTKTLPMGPITNIIGGQPSDEGEWPWQGILLIRDDSGDDDFRCGASLLATDWVLTAAHCIDVLNNPTVYTVVMGTTSIVELADTIQMLPAVGIYVHPEYERNNHDFDIALIQTTPFAINDHVRPVCTAPENWAEYLDPDVICTATGWGYTVDGGFASNILREVEVPIFDNDACQESYAPEPITDNMICAGYPWGGKDSCAGDDGGPLVTQVDDQWVQVGVVSWGEGCARENKPGVYTRVTAFEDWIEPIYSGGEPDGRISECPSGQFVCRDGWCIDYEMKCNGVRDCFYGDDEAYCEEDTLFFDLVSGKQLQSEFIRATFQGSSANDCSRRCLENYIDEPCLAFNIGGPDNDICYIAESQYRTQPSTGSISHFEIENMPCPGETIEVVNGRIATPKFLPLCRTTAEAGDFYWVIMPESSDDYNRLKIEFRSVHAPLPNDCSTPDSINTVNVRAGPDVNSPLIATYCLNDLPESVTVPAAVARIEFYTVDSDKYGFLANFNAFWGCDNEFTVGPGVFSTPNYPEPYPPGSRCDTVIQAPPDMQVLVFMRDFDLEPQAAGCRFDWDIMKVYDRNVPDENYLLGTYCGDDVPYIFRSTGSGLYITFQSDGSVNFPGFEAAYYFVEANATLPAPGNTTAECGLQTLPLEPEDQIVGGKPAQRGEYPWQVALYYYNTFICGGVLLTPEWVVTIASCAPTDSTVYDIVAGSNNVNGDTDMAQKFKVSEVVINPQFDFFSRRYDIALLRLSENATINDFVRTVCLPSEQDQTDFPGGTACTVTGWGETFEDGPGTDELYEVDVSIIDQALCRSQYSPEPVYDDHLCAGVLAGGQGVCRGDSGGPLVSKVENKWYLVGMPSWSRGCAEPDYPAVYTRVSYFEEWISSVIEGNYTKDIMCHANYTEAPGAVQSPFYPEFYPNDVMCESRITAPAGYSVYLTVRDFRLEDDGTVDCSRAFDSLLVYDSDRADEDALIGRYCGTTIPRNFLSTGSSLFIVFETDNSIADRGFDFAFYFVEDSGCSNEFTSAPGTFASPNYPESYPNNAECSNLVTAPANQRVFLVIQDFRLESDGSTCLNDFDTLTIYDSNRADPSKLIGVYCGDNIPQTIETTGESLYAVFKSDSSTTQRGFQAAFYFLPEMMPTTPPPTGPQPYCGRQTIDLDPEALLIGGGEAQVGEYPWHGGIRFSGMYQCGAALLTPYWAVTAAHCVLNDASNYDVILGTTNLVNVPYEAQSRQVSEVFIHPEFNDDTKKFDVALLKLSMPFPITDYIRTICAPSTNMRSDFEVGTNCVISGWGAQETGGSNAEMLHEIPQEVVSNGNCQNEFFPPVTDTDICAGSNNVGTCTGDDGGPLVSNVDGTWYLVGIASRTSLCAEQGSLYTRMTEFYGWLAPIFDGNDPEGRQPPDELEPIRKEIRAIQEEADLYMYLMYAFVGLIALLLLCVLYTAYTCSAKRNKLNAKLHSQRGEGHGATSQLTTSW